MKDLFPGYYSPSDEEFSELWQNCIFIFDTNVLLDFYEYNDETREDFFEVLEAIKDRLWIPHQVALEYQENRINRIRRAESNFDSAEKKLNEIIQDIIETFKYVPSELVEDMIKDIKKVFDSFKEDLIPLKENTVKIDGSDYIRDKITELFQEKIGESPTNQKELDQIYVVGEERYKICRPPGFKDKNNKDKEKPYIYKGLLFKREYGDLILWKQILKQVKSESLSHVIFITGDNKEDWWRIEHGKTIGGPHPELTEEIVDAGASMFYMYRPEGFLAFAKKYLQQEIKEKSIQQVEEVSVSNSLSEPELRGNFSTQLSAIDGSRLSNIERLIAANNPLSNIERLGLAANNPVSSIADFAKQLSATEARRLTNIDKYGLKNNIAIAGLMSEQNRFMASVNQTIENHNRVWEQIEKQLAIPKQSIPYVNQEIDIESSQEIESSEN
jgi:PIN like domain